MLQISVRVTGFGHSIYKFFEEIKRTAAQNLSEWFIVAVRCTSAVVMGPLELWPRQVWYTSPLRQMNRGHC
jgi:hypothetical protein